MFCLPKKSASKNAMFYRTEKIDFHTYEETMQLIWVPGRSLYSLSKYKKEGNVLRVNAN